MPCRSDYPDSYSTATEVKAELDLVTKLLCEVCETLRRLNQERCMAPELATWWKKHQKFDLRRKKSDLEGKLRVLNVKISHIKTLGGLPGKKLLDEHRRITQGLDALKVRG